jgi:Mrp family chromosome partitioning ATPase
VAKDPKKHRPHQTPSERIPLREDGLASPQSVGAKRASPNPDGGQPPRTLIMRALSLPTMPPPGGRVQTPSGGANAVPGSNPNGPASARVPTPGQGEPVAPVQSVPSRPQLMTVPAPVTPRPQDPVTREVPAPSPAPAPVGALVPISSPPPPVAYQGDSWSSPLPSSAPIAQPWSPAPHEGPARQGVALRKKLRPDVPKAVVEAMKVTLSGRRDPRVSLLGDQGSGRAAAFRVLRHRLMGRGDPRTVLVTSAVDGEGKTSCAINLAVALAESGRFKVLLLDANVHRPAVASALGVQPPWCFLEQLANHRDDMNAHWVVTELEPVGMHVLAIAPQRNEARALHGPSFTAAMDRLRGAYDYIVVDGSSVLTGSEATLISDSVDGLIIVTKAHRARARLVRKALELFPATDIIGTVLMDI